MVNKNNIGERVAGVEATNPLSGVIRDELAWVRILAVKKMVEARGWEGEQRYNSSFIQYLIDDNKLEEARKILSSMDTMSRKYPSLNSNQKLIRSAQLSACERKVGMIAEADKDLDEAIYSYKQADMLHSNPDFPHSGAEVLLAMTEAGDFAGAKKLIHPEGKMVDGQLLFETKYQFAKRLIENGRIAEGEIIAKLLEPENTQPVRISHKLDLAELLADVYIKNGEKEKIESVAIWSSQEWQKMSSNTESINFLCRAAKLFYLAGREDMVEEKIAKAIQKISLSGDQPDRGVLSLMIDKTMLETKTGDRADILKRIGKHKINDLSDGRRLGVFADENYCLLECLLLAGDFEKVKYILEGDNMPGNPGWILTGIKQEELGVDMSDLLSIVQWLANSNYGNQLRGKLYMTEKTRDEYGKYGWEIARWLMKKGDVASVAKMFGDNDPGMYFDDDLIFHAREFLGEYREGKTIDMELLKKLLVVDGQLDYDLIRDLGTVAGKGNWENMLSDLTPKFREKALMELNSFVLKQSLITDDEGLKDIFVNATKRIGTALKDDGEFDNEVFRLAARVMYRLKSKEATDFIFNMVRELSQTIDLSVRGREKYVFMRLIKTLAEINTMRGNDLLFGIFKDERLGKHESMYLLLKLVQNEYLAREVRDWVQLMTGVGDEKGKKMTAAEWWNNRLNGNFSRGVKKESDCLEVIKILAREGISPSRDLLEWITKKSSHDMVARVREKLKVIEKAKVEFENMVTAEDLRQLLVEDKEKAMIYYILYNGKTKFDLINNYSFEKFYELLTLTKQLKLNETPLIEFENSLEKAGFEAVERKAIIDNLQAGRQPFAGDESKYVEMMVRLDVSNQAKFESARKEVGGVFGRDQIGVCLKASFYRSFLTVDGSERANDLLVRLNQTADVSGRRQVVSDIEKQFPNFLLATIKKLELGWVKLEEKMGFGGVSVENLLSNNENIVDVEVVLGNIENKREELKLAKRDLILALKQDNPQVSSLNSEIWRKRKAISGLEKGLGKNPELQGRIDLINAEIDILEKKVATIGLSPLASRFAQLSDKERLAKADEESRELEALNSKDPARILMYQIMQLSGEDQLIENDVSVIREVASHLEGPLQIISDLAKLDKKGKRTQQTKMVKIRMMDKKDDLMTMVRFADSKICCFSSSNYTMRVAHNTENKVWVASINKDPLSFVFEIEDEETGGVKNNQGFVFGMYGVSKTGQPEVFLNGIYHTGGNDIASASNIAQAIEMILSVPIRAEHQFMASMYGGRVGILPDYVIDPVRAKRLRALDNGRGEPEKHVYDDLGKEINEWVDYQYDNNRAVIHKTLRTDVEGEELDEN